MAPLVFSAIITELPRPKQPASLRYDGTGISSISHRAENFEERRIAVAAPRGVDVDALKAVVGWMYSDKKIVVDDGDDHGRLIGIEQVAREVFHFGRVGTLAEEVGSSLWLLQLIYCRRHHLRAFQACKSG